MSLQVRVMRAIDGGELLTLPVKSRYIIKDIKLKVQATTDIPYDEQKLLFGSRKCEDNETIASLAGASGHDIVTVLLHVV